MNYNILIITTRITIMIAKIILASTTTIITMIIGIITNNNNNNHNSNNTRHAKERLHHFSPWIWQQPPSLLETKHDIVADIVADADDIYIATAYCLLVLLLFLLLPVFPCCYSYSCYHC